MGEYNPDRLQANPQVGSSFDVSPNKRSSIMSMNYMDRSHSGFSYRTGTSLNGGINVKSTLLGNLSGAPKIKITHAMTK